MKVMLLLFQQIKILQSEGGPFVKTWRLAKALALAIVQGKKFEIISSLK